MFSREDGSLTFVAENPIVGTDAIGSFVGGEFTWNPSDLPFRTSYRNYLDRDVVVFKQDFRNYDEVIRPLQCALFS